MDKKVISCVFNIDTACVEIKFGDRNMIAIDCTLVEVVVARNIPPLPKSGEKVVAEQGVLGT